jgi:hypothetical protein
MLLDLEPLLLLGMNNEKQCIYSMSKNLSIQHIENPSNALEGRFFFVANATIPY